MQELGKTLLEIGLALVLVGIVMLLAGRFGLLLGRLPGDFAWRGKTFAVFLPLGTSLFLSVVLSVLAYLFMRFRR
jgi:hypothetical protein